MLGEERSLFNKKYQILGITLIELLCSLLISSVILSAVIAIYSLVQKHFKQQTALHNLTENSRIVEQLWMTAIHSAAYRGCFKAAKINISPYYHADVKTGTDAFSIDDVDALGDDVLFDMKDNDVIYATNSHNLSVNDDILISDCETLELAKVKNVTISSNNQKITIYKPLNKLYKKFSQINTYQRDSYYIGNTHRFDQHHQMIYALYQIKNGKKTEIMEGINDMKITVSMLKEGVMIDQPLTTLTEDVVGISIALKHDLNKIQYSYVAIR